MKTKLLWALLIFSIISVKICLADSSNDVARIKHLQRWNLKSEVKGSDVILVGRLIPITLYGAGINDCYLIVADDVISGELQQVSILELPNGVIVHRVQVYQEMVKKYGSGGLISEKHAFQAQCSEFQHLFFLKKANRSFVGDYFSGLSVYQPVGGCDGIVALDILSVEQHSRQQIDLQYNLNIIDSSQEFINAIKYFLLKKRGLDDKVVDERLLLEPVQAIYKVLSEGEDARKCRLKPAAHRE